MSLIVNLYGGPGAGKSTMAAATFAELKMRGLNVELATEYAKDMCWSESYRVLENQIYVFAKQYHRIWRLLEKVDIVITDSPLLLSLIYDKTNMKEFRDFVIAIHNQLNNYNIFLNRKKDYSPIGRIQTEEEAKQIDKQILDILNKNKFSYELIDADIRTTNLIVDKILDHYKEGKNGRK